MSEHDPGIVDVPEILVPVPVEDLGSVHIERLIFACERQSAAAQVTYRELVIEAASADHAYKLAYSRALLDAGGPMELRKASALIAAEEELYAKQMADARRDAQRELIASIKLRMDGLRTVSANIRTQTSGS